MVSEAFADKRLVARHRLINAALLDEDGTLGFHSLSIGAAKTPAEWGVSAEVPASPQCMGGDGSGLKRCPSSSRRDTPWQRLGVHESAGCGDRHVKRAVVLLETITAALCRICIVQT